VSAAVLLAWCATAAALLVVVGATRRRAELAARACHELAGPLQAAGLALHAARREAPSPRLAAVDLELRRAARALDDLDAARAGRRALDAPGVVDAGVLVAGQALVWQVAARERGRGLRVAAGAGLLVTADPVRLAQAVGNLLANALEHGEGTVELRVSRAGGRVRIAVGDEGRGLPADVAALVRRARAGRGSRGRGLAIAAGIAERHGGRLVAGDGATLVLELPAVSDRRLPAPAPLPFPPGLRRR
jgi:signal transduction histidine kinase